MSIKDFEDRAVVRGPWIFHFVQGSYDAALSRPTKFPHGPHLGDPSPAAAAARDGALGRLRGARPADGGRPQPPPLPPPRREGAPGGEVPPPRHEARLRAPSRAPPPPPRAPRRRPRLPRPLRPRRHRRRPGPPRRHLPRPQASASICIPHPNPSSLSFTQISASASVSELSDELLELGGRGYPTPHSSVRGEIEEAERREEEWDRFYEAKRKEMEEFQAMSGWFEAAARDEVQSLRDLVSQLKSTLQEHHGGVMYLNNAEITAAEARKSDLMAKKAKLDESLASARQFRALLQQQLQKSFASQIGDQKTTQTTI
nr:serine/arginine repetitive matrix protein 1 isoform X1 [Oryza sativa Japonica Group]